MDTAILASVTSSDGSDLATRRRDAQRLVKHLQFLAENYVDQALVKEALLRGLSQSEVAKLLGMSKKTVNTHARVPFMRYASAIDPRADDRVRCDREFFAYVWGSDEAMHAAVARCKQYDRERLLVESD
ncbi:hypothetical protein [Rhodococcus jostii]|uniref:hypothetical protein n=1 Tax=Rhodococcus jostii TaxID=132919 RepID=UPI00365AAFD6